MRRGIRDGGGCLKSYGDAGGNATPRGTRQTPAHMPAVETAPLPRPTSTPDTLAGETEALAAGKAVAWYRTRIDKTLLKSLHAKSDARGFAQTLGHLAVLAATGTAAILAWVNEAWGWLALALFVHGTCSSFMINAVHELTHGTVFKTRWLNEVFAYVYAFLGWNNHEMFTVSHLRHHRYTLHQPDDLEVTLPMRLVRAEFFRQAFFNYQIFWQVLRGTARVARGRFTSTWDQFLFPADDPELRRRPVRWARIVLAGHGAILLVAVLTGWWILPLVISLAPFTANGLFFLCNNTQHIGLQDSVSDFRLCCRTFTTNPVVQFLYWHMNFHIEHHMFAAVPCYHLARLHRAIRHDLPPCPHGLAQTWREIAAIQKMQEENPGYQFQAVLPVPAR